MSTMLAPERLLFAGRTHPKILVIPVLVQIVLLVIHFFLLKYLPTDLGSEDLNTWAPVTLHAMVLAAELWYAIIPIVRWWHSRFEVTNRRVRARWGVFYKNSQEINLDRITQVSEERGILDRIFGAGTILMHDAANTQGIRFHDVPHFRRARRILDDARQQAYTQHQHQQQMAAANIPPPPGAVW